VEIDSTLAPPAPPVANVSVPPTAKPAPNPPPPVVDHDVKPASTLTPAWIAGGVGIVGLSVGTIFAVRAHQSQSDSDRLAADGNPDAFTRYDDTKRNVTIARVGFGVGLIGVGLSTYFLVTSKKEEPKKTARFDAVAAPGLAVVSFGGVW